MGFTNLFSLAFMMIIPYYKFFMDVVNIDLSLGFAGFAIVCGLIFYENNYKYKNSKEIISK